ncbi:hypothetical protein EXN66_Car013215 [Channa argus]|uniref:C-type lectin domain-containing protein n=1 Tax=Channa argus TaxID=215402 RepID=A0A6G1Q4S1_CHAAH|nr:hypothetical protein EXN66_Car013215 [Channa argus]
MNQLINTVSSAGYNSEVWIGLYNQINWRWSDGYTGNGAGYRNWKTAANQPDFDSADQFFVSIGSDGQWWDDYSFVKHPFICYRETVRKQVVRLMMKLEDSSVDLNDPAVKADLLKQFQDRLKDNGLSDVTLKWREQPDGKVFHKNQKKN